MAAEKKTMSFKADPGLREDVLGYRRERGLENQSDAHEELVKIGLREARSPIMYRLRDLALEGAWNLALAAVVVVVAGHMTTALNPGNSILIAAVLLSVGAALVGCAELIRTLRGHGELSELLAPGVGQ